MDKTRNNFEIEGKKSKHFLFKNGSEKGKNIKKRQKISYEQYEFSRQLLEDIHEVCKKRKNLILRYSQTDDKDLIESIIYEELALKSKYCYLVKIAKSNAVKLDKRCLFIDWETIASQ
jgi:hypothetical protein